MNEDEFRSLMGEYGIKNEAYVRKFWLRFGSRMTKEDLEFILKLFKERATKEEKEKLIDPDS